MVHSYPSLDTFNDWFIELNCLFFDNILDINSGKISYINAMSAGGWFRIDKKRKTHTWDLRINMRYKHTLAEFKSLLCHEMIHYWQALAHPEEDDIMHGKWFIKKMNEINCYELKSIKMNQIKIYDCFTQGFSDEINENSRPILFSYLDDDKTINFCIFKKGLLEKFKKVIGKQKLELGNFYDADEIVERSFRYSSLKNNKINYYLMDLPKFERFVEKHCTII